jgi:hypothetical protein
MVIIFTANMACAGNTVKVPDNTAAILYIDKDGKIIPADANGKKVKPCTLPSEKAENVCHSLIKSTTLKRGDFVDIFVNHQNPCYITIFIGGMQVEIPVPDAYCQ